MSDILKSELVRNFNWSKTSAKNLLKKLRQDGLISDEENKELISYINRFYEDKELLVKSYEIGSNKYRKVKRDFNVAYKPSEEFYLSLVEQTERKTDMAEIIPPNEYKFKSKKRVKELRDNFRRKINNYSRIVKDGEAYGLLNKNSFTRDSFYTLQKGLILYLKNFDTQFLNFPNIFYSEDFEEVIDKYVSLPTSSKSDGVIINIPFEYRTSDGNVYTRIMTFTGLVNEMDIILDEIDSFIQEESLFYNGDPLIESDFMLLEFIFVLIPRGGCLDYFQDKMNKKLLNILIENKNYNIYSPKRGKKENNCFFGCLLQYDKKLLRSLSKKYGYKNNDSRNLKTIFKLKRNEMVDCKKAYEIIEQINTELEDYNLDFDIFIDVNDFINRVVNKKITKPSLLCYDDHWLLCTPRVFDIKKETFKPRKIANIYKTKNIVFYDIEASTYDPDLDLNPEETHFVHKVSVIGYRYEGEEFNICFNFSQLLDLLSLEFEEENNDEIVLCSYNGSRYDDYFLLKECLDLEEFKLLRFGFDNGRLAGLVFSYNGRIFSTLDLSRFVVGSLEDVLTAYKCNYKKASFKYALIKEDFFEMSEDLQADLIAYLKIDVNGMMELYNKVEASTITIIEALEDKVGYILDKTQFKLYNYVSSSQLTYDLWLRTYYAEIDSKDLGEEYKLYKHYHLQQAEIIQKSIYGGRTQVFKKEHTPSLELMSCIKEIGDFDYSTGTGVNGKDGYKLYNSVNNRHIVDKIISLVKDSDKLFDLDVNSLYPFAMIRAVYPVGQPEFFLIYHPEQSREIIELFRNGSIGFFICDVEFPKRTTKDLVVSPHPRRIKTGLSWDLVNRQQELNSIDILRLISEGCRVRLIKGYVYNTTYKVFETYQTIITDMKVKHKDNKPLKNQAKNLANALYGKQGQKPRATTEEVLTNETIDRLYNFVKDKTIENLELKIVYKYGMEVINENFKIVNKSVDYTKFDLTKIYIKRKTPIKIFHYTKPNYLGSSVLGYTRNIMWEIFEILECKKDCKNLPHYMDTDSVHVNKEGYLKLLNAGMLSDTRIGGLKNDMDDERGEISDEDYLSPNVIDKECFIIRGLFIGLKFYIDIGVSNHKNKENYIFFHKRAKGVDSKHLTYNDYSDISKGTEKTFTQPSIFNRLNFKVDKQKAKKGLSRLDIYGLKNMRVKKLKEDVKNVIQVTSKEWGSLYLPQTNDDVINNVISVMPKN